MSKVLIVLFDDNGNEIDSAESKERHLDFASFLFQDSASKMYRNEIGVDVNESKAS